MEGMQQQPRRHHQQDRASKCSLIGIPCCKVTDRSRIYLQWVRAGEVGTNACKKGAAARALEAMKERKLSSRSWRKVFSRSRRKSTSHLRAKDAYDRAGQHA
jgi:hypothetical protein